MFASILIPLDLTKRNTEALRIARGLVREGDHLTLLHAIELIPGLDRDEEPAFYDLLESTALTHLQGLAAEQKEKGIATEVVVEFGKRVEVILAWVESHEVGLIVLASHPIDRTSPVRSWGTLSYQISLLSPCSVLLVK